MLVKNNKCACSSAESVEQLLFLKQMSTLNSNDKTPQQFLDFPPEMTWAVNCFAIKKPNDFQLSCRQARQNASKACTWETKKKGKVHPDMLGRIDPSLTRYDRANLQVCWLPRIFESSFFRKTRALSIRSSLLDVQSLIHSADFGAYVGGYGIVSVDCLLPLIHVFVCSLSKQTHWACVSLQQEGRQYL